MSTTELAQAINEYLWTERKMTTAVDHRFVSNYEAGAHWWPSRHYREAFRRVLKVATDADLGFAPRRARTPQRRGKREAQGFEEVGAGRAVETSRPAAVLNSTAGPAPRASPREGASLDHGNLADEFVSVPVETPSGVVAYVVTRRTFLTALTTAIPGLVPGRAEQIQTPSAAVSPFRDAPGFTLPAADVLERRPAEWSSFLTVTRLLASQRQAIAPDVLSTLVDAHRDSLAMLFNRAKSDPVRADIGVLLGETSIVSSRLWSARGNRTMAIANCAYARQLADSLGDDALGATARLFESNLHSDAATLIGHDGDIIIGLRLLEEASAVGQALPPSARARIAAEQAQSFAVLQLKAESQHALGRAREALNEIGDADRTGLFSDWSPSRLLVYEGTCSLLLGDSKRAVDQLTQSLRESESDDSNLSVRLAATVDLASAYADGGDLDAACHTLADTYARLIKVGNHRGTSRALNAVKRLQPWRRQPAVRQLDEQIRAIGTLPVAS